MEAKISCFELKKTPRDIQNFFLERDVEVNHGANDQYLTLSGSVSEVNHAIKIIKDNRWFEK